MQRCSDRRGRGRRGPPEHERAIDSVLVRRGPVEERQLIRLSRNLDDEQIEPTRLQRPDRHAARGE
jgi:hypothetical protein